MPILRFPPVARVGDRTGRDDRNSPDDQAGPRSNASCASPLEHRLIRIDSAIEPRWPSPMPRLIPLCAASMAVGLLASCSSVDNSAPTLSVAMPSAPPLAAAPEVPPAPQAGHPGAASALAGIPTPGRQSASRQILAANGVYLARVQVTSEIEHHIITEIRRHDPALGPAPEIGSEWQPGSAHAPSKIRSDHVIICVTGTDRGRTMTTTPLVNGHLVVGNVPIDALRAAVAAGHAAKPVPPARFSGGPTPERSIATASEVYLVQVDTSDGLVRYRVSEVWRHTGPGSAPAVGEEVMPDPKRVYHPTIQYGLSAVVFLFPRPTMPAAGVSRWVGAQTATVQNGYAWGTIPLGELHERVDAATAAAATATAGTH
jgi:hypothetical protein